MFKNREGHAVDPVPYLVVASGTFLGSFSFVPVYGLSLGLSPLSSVGAATAVFAGLAAVAYHQMVWTARPELQGEVPAAQRLQRVFYVALVVGGVVLLATLLLLWW
jgi:hypothetical protein